VLFLILILTFKLFKKLVHIYYSYLSKENHKDLLVKNLFKFPIDFQNKINQYKRWQDKQSSILGRILLLKGIEEVYGLNYQDQTIYYSQYHKPYFKDSIVQFNISHSENIVVCALSSEIPIGIDIEAISPIKIEDFRFQMTNNEWNKIIFSKNKKVSFFDYWTKKEAALKSHGHGLSIPLNSFEISEDRTNIRGHEYLLNEVQIDLSYKCYISLQKKNNDRSKNICYKTIKLNNSQ